MTTGLKIKAFKFWALENLCNFFLLKQFWY